MSAWSSIQIKRTIKQDQELQRVICRFEQEFAAAWNRSPDERELLRNARVSFDTIIAFLRQSIYLLFSEATYDLLDMPSITNEHISQDAETKRWRTFNQWRDYVASYEYKPRVILEKPEVLWTLCPPIESPSVTLWSYTAPSAAAVLVGFYYAFSYVIEEAVEATFAAPGRSQLKGFWRIQDSVVFPAFRLRQKQYPIPKKRVGQEKPPSADDPIRRSTPYTETTTYEVHERWILTDPHSYMIEPSEARAVFFRYSTRMREILDGTGTWRPDALNGLSIPDNDGKDGPLLRRLAMGQHSEPMVAASLFKPLTNSELSFVLKVSTQSVAGYRRTAEGTKQLDPGSKMQPAVVRALLYYYAGWARGKDTQQRARDEIDKRSRAQIDPKPGPN